jgi:hypothetical protein
MRSSLLILTLSLAIGAAICAYHADAVAQGPNTVRLLSGGGRIWEGESVSQPACDITFSGHIEKIGPGNTRADYRCRWKIHFQDVQGFEYDGAVFTARECRELTLWNAGGEPDVSMRVALLGDLNGVPGYSVIMVVVDWSEPSSRDNIRFRLS